ncbi:MAG: hypothetical protein QM820_46650 [Minicystis sp.]
MPLAWYGRGRDTYGTSATLGIVCLVGAVAVSAALAYRAGAAQDPARKPLLALAITVPIVSYLPILFEHERGGGPAAASFLLVWSLIGYSAYRLGRIRLLNLATAFLGIRLLIIYFEVFGSLLDTGIGLLSGGVLTVLLAWLWVKKSRQWSEAGRGAQGGKADPKPHDVNRGGKHG